MLRLHYLDCEDQSVRILIENAVELSRKGASGVLFSRRQEYQLTYGITGTHTGNQTVESLIMALKWNSIWHFGVLNLYSFVICIALL